MYVPRKGGTVLVRKLGGAAWTGKVGVGQVLLIESLVTRGGERRRGVDKRRTRRRVCLVRMMMKGRNGDASLDETDDDHRSK